MIGSEVAFKNPTHAQSQRLNRTIGWKYENHSSNRKCKARRNSAERSNSVLVRRVQSSNRRGHGLVGSVVRDLAQRELIPEVNTR